MLSLSMIVRDEASRLERCLESVAGFVDEMVRGGHGLDGWHRGRG